MKVLVTGSNGFVGSHIAETLLDAGHKVICLVRPTSDRKWLKNSPYEFRCADMIDPATLPYAIKDIDVIVHSAGIVRAKKKETYYEVNQLGTRNLVESALKHNPKLKKFIFISSQAAMGPSSSEVPKLVSETETPVSDYGKSKLEAEKEVRKLINLIPFTILRPSSVYGPRDKDIFIFFKLVNLGICPKPLTKRFLQLVFVKDVALAVLKSMQASASDNKTYFLAEDKSYSMDEIGDIISQVAGKRVFKLPIPDFIFKLLAAGSELAASLSGKPAVLNSQKIDEMLKVYWLGNASTAEKDLGMDFTNLKIGAKITYSWYKENRWF